MAQITKAIASEHRLVANLVPTEVLKQIDQAELYDRIIHAEDLGRRSRGATDVTLRKGYAQLAKAVLSARPRAEVARQSAELVAKAAGLPPASRQASALRYEAQQLLEQHPAAPRRAEHRDVAVAKAKAADADHLTVVYDPAGQPIGLVDPSKIQPVTVRTAKDVKEDVQKAGKGRRPGLPVRRVSGRR